ncbi:MAG: FAD-dependent oxidoreductase [Flavobacteriaceae bacterium]|jgi:glycine/D-amino acid oxidase-like deaminating enzyme|nr:FAD-dependent oxidoreductase [Flavobacteriaceae bacterium]
MKNTDYIIVGSGFAAIFFAHRLIKNKKNFVLFSGEEKSASQISAGIINPAVLKKFTTFWMAQEQIDFLHKTLSEIEVYTGKNYFVSAPVQRIFHDENEQKLWLKKSEDTDLKPFLNPEFKKYDVIKNPFKTGEVMQSGRLDVSAFFEDMFDYLKSHHHLVEEKLNYETLNPIEKKYKNLGFNKIVFCEGMAVLDNPYFSETPIVPNKGHHLKVKLSEKIDENATFKKKHFLFPLKNGLHYYGGTYDVDQTQKNIDDYAVQELKDGLLEFYPDDFEIETVEFGFRPTVKDRRPILGKHPEFPDFYIFNGLGARGVLNGNYFAKHLFDFIEFGKPLLPETDLCRF